MGSSSTHTIAPGGLLRTVNLRRTQPVLLRQTSNRTNTAVRSRVRGEQESWFTMENSLRGGSAGPSEAADARRRAPGGSISDGTIKVKTDRTIEGKKGAGV